MLSTYCDGKVFGERTGAGSPRVLALHGWRKDHRDLVKVVAGFDAISLDQPGFGASPEPTEVWGAAEYAHGIAAVLDEFESPPVVFGHSFGGRVALHLAQAYPDRVRSIVLTGAPLLRRESNAKAPLAFRLAKAANRLGVLSDERMEAERQKRGSDDYRAARGIMRDIFVKVVNESYEDQLRAVACPVELVWGQNDTEAPLWQAEAAMDMLKNGKLTVVPGGSHWIVNTDPEPLRSAIERSLA